MIEVVGEFQILYRVQFNILTSMTHYYLFIFGAYS